MFLRDRPDGRDVFRRRVVVSEANAQLRVEVLDQVLHGLEAAELPGEAVLGVGAGVEARRRFARIGVHLLRQLPRRRRLGGGGGGLEFVEVLPVLLKVGQRRRHDRRGTWACHLYSLAALPDSFCWGHQSGERSPKENRVEGASEQQGCQIGTDWEGNLAQSGNPGEQRGRGRTGRQCRSSSRSLVQNKPSHAHVIWFCGCTSERPPSTIMDIELNCNFLTENLGITCIKD